MHKFKVGDKVIVTNVRRCTYGRVFNIIECRIGNKYKLDGSAFIYSEDELKLNTFTKDDCIDDWLNELCDDTNTKHKRIRRNKEEGEKVNMAKLTDIRVGSKIVSILQKNAAPQKVECKTVILTIDGKEYEAVCMPEDEFSLEKGIEIALLKSFLGGTKAYSKYIHNAVKFFDACEKKRAEEKRIETKREKEIARKIARREKKANEARQARVNEMSEAFLKAMRDYDGMMDSMVDEDTTQVVNFSVEKMCEDFLKSKGLVAVPVEDVETHEDDLK